jgi:hypothetical protein
VIPQTKLYLHRLVSNSSRVPSGRSNSPGIPHSTAEPLRAFQLRHYVQTTIHGRDFWIEDAQAACFLSHHRRMAFFIPVYLQTLPISIYFLRPRPISQGCLIQGDVKSWLFYASCLGKGYQIDESLARCNVVLGSRCCFYAWT